MLPEFKDRGGVGGGGGAGGEKAHFLFCAVYKEPDSEKVTKRSENTLKPELSLLYYYY